MHDFTGIFSIFLAESEDEEEDRGDSESRVDPKNILLLAGSPDCVILCSEIFGSDLNGCLSNPLPGVASNTRGGPDWARLGDPLDDGLILIRGDEGFLVFPLNNSDPDKRKDPGFVGLPRFISSRSGLDSTGPDGTAGITGPIFDS